MPHRGPRPNASSVISDTVAQSATGGVRSCPVITSAPRAHSIVQAVAPRSERGILSTAAKPPAAPWWFFIGIFLGLLGSGTDARKAARHRAQNMATVNRLPGPPGYFALGRIDVG